jgi:hypothetical protein
LPRLVNVTDDIDTGLRSAYAKEEMVIGNAFMTKRRWRDLTSSSLEQWKEMLGSMGRSDIQAYFDLCDADEGRETWSGDSLERLTQAR